mgnify:CR=1 FL=1
MSKIIEKEKSQIDYEVKPSEKQKWEFFQIIPDKIEKYEFAQESKQTLIKQ